LATEPSPQRAYRAACPNCGAPVEFRSAASAFGVCSFCRSTIVREGEALRKIGESAELFDDHSPLQLGAGGTYQGSGFTLVGRLQYRYKDGTWNEWHALFDSGRSGWLSEDNGRYVIAFDAPVSGAPAAAELRAGQQQTVGGQVWSVASVNAARLVAAQGELPYPPNTDRGFVVADLRNTRDEVGTLDYSDAAAPRWSVGRAVALGELAMSGLADGAEKTLRARSIECPSCGSSLEVKLSTTQSIVCHQCHAVVDLTTAGGGVGGDLAHYAQDNGSEPQIPLGRVGTIAFGAGPAKAWQVVGYVERCEIDDDEQAFWREYLLYHRTEGFTFLVDAEDGWSWTAPVTGVPTVAGDTARYQGASYRKMYDYTGKITYVLGEFYWQLRRGELTYNTDYQGTGGARNKRLNRERTGGGADEPNGGEVVWSAGETLSADVVAKAFRLEGSRVLLQRDATPASGNAASLLAKVFFWVFVVVVLLMLFRCSDDDNRRDCEPLRASYGEASQEYQSCLASNRSGGYRTSGGSWGGFSSGGGHK
jgi:ribosomal protein L37AE/L43A